RHPGAEMAEVASMSMELLSSPYIDRDHGGYYDEAEALRSRRGLLERTVLFFTHCASVDAFQQWMYTTPDGRDRDARDRKWLELRGAVRKYREALALGGTKPLPELYKAAGARLIFDGDGMRELIDLAEEELAGLDA